MGKTSLVNPVMVHQRQVDVAKQEHIGRKSPSDEPSTNLTTLSA